MADYLNIFISHSLVYRSVDCIFLYHILIYQILYAEYIISYSSAKQSQEGLISLLL